MLQGWSCYLAKLLPREAASGGVVGWGGEREISVRSPSSPQTGPASAEAWLWAATLSPQHKYLFQKPSLQAPHS